MLLDARAPVLLSPLQIVFLVLGGWGVGITAAMKVRPGDWHRCLARCCAQDAASGGPDGGRQRQAAHARQGADGDMCNELPRQVCRAGRYPSRVHQSLHTLQMFGGKEAAPAEAK